MSSAVIKGHVGLSHNGNIYNCQINGHSLLADDESELFDAIGKVIEPEYVEPFNENGFTWTFVRDDSAADYNVARKHPEHRTTAATKTTYGITGAMFASHGSLVVNSPAFRRHLRVTFSAAFRTRRATASRF